MMPVMLTLPVFICLTVMTLTLIVVFADDDNSDE